MQGAGNDYVYIDLAEERVEEPGRLARILSDRHFGVGGDGVILIAPSDRAGGRMIMFNADGSEGSMCGNGVRCVAKFLFDRGRIPRTATIETKSGIVSVEMVEVVGGRAEQVRVNMGPPRLAPAQVPTTLAATRDGAVVGARLEAGDRSWNVTCVSMGNPHCVIFTEGIDSLDLAALGAPIENHEVFPDRANVEFVEVAGEGRLRQRTWERGSGETLACGTGACAVTVAAHLNGLSGRSSTVDLRGGVLRIEWTATGEVLMTGPAVEVFSGTVDPGRLGPPA